MNGSRDLQQVNDLCREAQSDAADLRARQQQKGKDKGAGEKQLWVLSFKAKAGRHAFERLKDKVSDQERPAHRHEDLHDIVHNRNMALEICKVHAHNVQQCGRKILPAFQHKPIGPLQKALENQFKQC